MIETWQRVAAAALVYVPENANRWRTIMDVKDFYYDLPQELIAQDPLEDRSSSRLMVLDKITGEVEHRHFKDITEYLRPATALSLITQR